MTNLDSALFKLFERRRIVFWYDANRELRQQYEELWLPGVEKLEIAGNEFALKHTILREKQNQKFLLYHHGPRPADEENWLLDVLLAEAEFRADQISLWLSELGLKPDDWEFVQAHVEFFKSGPYREKFRALLQANPAARQHKEQLILSVLLDFNTLALLEDVLSALMEEEAAGEPNLLVKIQTAGLESYLWAQVEKTFGYTSDLLTVKDFSVALFKACYKMEVNEEAALKPEALVFMRRWKDSARFQPAFEVLADQCAHILGMDAELQKHTLSVIQGVEESRREYNLVQLLDADLFELIDQRLIQALIEAVTSRTLTGGDVQNIVWQRRKTHWFSRYQHIYLSIQSAAQFFSLQGQIKLQISDPAAGFNAYTQTWFQLDRLYRKAHFHARQSRQLTLLAGLLEQLESQYTNRYVLALNDQWQQHINALDQWEIPGVRMQRKFHFDRVQPFLDKNTRLAVIISDALRYEIASELSEQIEALKGFETQLEAMLGALPSYTQMGMAALLPNNTLEIRADGSVWVDGLPSAGLENRAKILQQAHGPSAAAVKAEEILAMGREELREFFRQKTLVYVYHNQIDAVGDKRETEQRVFNAVEEAQQELITLVKKIANANTSYIFITADHGFLYQESEVDEGDYASQDVRGDEVTFKNRRFALGHEVKESASANRYQPAQMGLNGEVEIIIPKSINRLRLQGSGSRFVHGGSSLQEIVVPLVSVHKVEGRETPLVTVEIIRGATSTITSGQISVTFYQKESIETKMLPRTLRAGIYALDGTLLSDQHELVFDLSAENPAEREVKVRFLLNRQAESHNNEEVELRLEEQVAGTSHYVLYKHAPYRLKKSITTDFDF